MTAFITSQFSYCSLVCMFHSRTLKNRINKIHEKALIPIYKDETFFCLDDLLKYDDSLKRQISAHLPKNLHILATEIYMKKYHLGAKIMNYTFHFIQEPYNLKNEPELQRLRNCSVYFGADSISLLFPKILKLIPSNIRNANPAGIFKKIIKFWTTNKCPYIPCKTYIGNVGFILKCFKEKKHTACGVNLSSFSNDSLYISNFLRFNIDV